MANLYFNAAVDNDWYNLNNWWTNEACTTQASSLPTSVDDVITSAYVYGNSGSPAVANNLIIGADFNIDVTVTGSCTLNSYQTFAGTMNGNCVINEGAQNNNTIIGNCIFSDGAYNNGSITGNCIFNSGSYNNGTINGDANFNDNSYNLGTISGTVVWNGLTGTNSSGTFNQGRQVLYFNAADNNNHTNISNWWKNSIYTVVATSLPVSFNDVIIDGNINNANDQTIMYCYNLTAINSSRVNTNVTLSNGGVATFNDSSAYSYENNNTTITLLGNAIFNDGSSLSNNYANIIGNVIFNDYARHIGRTLGNIVFNDYSYIDGQGGNPEIRQGENTTAIFNDYSGVGNAQIKSEFVTFNDFVMVSRDYYYYEPNDLRINSRFVTFNDYSGLKKYQDEGWYVMYNVWEPYYGSQTVIFNDNSSYWLGGTSYPITMIFRGNSRNLCGTARYSSSYTTFEYEKGINGSSILGIV